jgi:hypothetical protein
MDSLGNAIEDMDPGLRLRIAMEDYDWRLGGVVETAAAGENRES